MAASAYITLTAKDGVTPTLKKIQGEMEAVARSVRSFGDNIASFATLGFGIGAAKSIYEVGKASVEAQIQLQKLDKAFEAIYGSSSQSQQQLEFLRTTSRELGQEFYSAAEGAKSFFAAGQGTGIADQLNDIYTGFTKAGAALSLSADDMKGIFLALGQTLSKGKVQAEELRGQIGERLPGAFQMAAQAMSMSTAELDKFMADGKLLAEDLLPKLARVLEDQYGAAAESMANTIQGAVNRMSTAWTDFKANLMDSELVVASLNAISDVLEGINAALGADKAGDALTKRMLADEGYRVNRSWQERQGTFLGFLPQRESYYDFTDQQKAAYSAYEGMQAAVDEYIRLQEAQEEKALGSFREAQKGLAKKTYDGQAQALKELRDERIKAARDAASFLADPGEADRLIADANAQYERDMAKLDKKFNGAASTSARKAAVSQADYNGELERTRQTIDSLQQQLGLDKTEDLARAKIRIEQQYQATLSKTNEELVKQVAQGKLTQGQADALKVEKDKAAELQRQVSLRDAERKAQEKSIQLAEGQLKFFRELGELSGDYGQSIELQNDLIEKQARKYKDVYQISDELVDKWTELQKLQVSQDPFDGAYRGLLKFSAEYINSGKQWESITYNFARDFNDVTRDMFSDFLDTGRASFASLEQSFSSLVKNMAYQAFVQPVVLSIVGGVQQSVYGMTTAGSSGANLLSTGAGLAQQYASNQLFSSMGGSGLLSGVTSGINSFGASLLPSVFAPNATIAAVNAGTATPAQVIAAMQAGHSGVAGLSGATTTVTGLLGAAGLGFGLGSLGGGLLGNLVGLNSGGSSIGGGIGGALGAGIGSIVPGIGTALGGIVGGALGSIVGGLFGGGGDKDPWVNISSWVDLLGEIDQYDPYQARSYRTSGTGYEITANQGEGISWETGKELADMAASLAQEAIKSVATFRESVAAIGNEALEAQFEAALEQNRYLKHWYEWEDREIKPEELTEDFNRAIQEKLYLSLAAVDVSSLTTAADGALADTMPEVTKAVTDAIGFVALGANLGEYQDDFNSAISDKLLEALNQMDTSGIALDIDKSSLAGWQDAAEALQGWQTVTDALDEILEPTSELASTLATATTQFDGWIDQLDELGWKEEAIAEIEAKRAQYMDAYASALTRASEQDLYLRSLSLQYGEDSLEYGLQSLQYQQQNELAELAEKFGRDSAIYNQAVETQQAELLAYQIQYWQSMLQEQVNSQQQVVDALDDLVDALEDARADLWAGDKNLMGTRYDEALAQFDAAYQQAMSGDQEALAQLPTLAGSLLALGKDNLATSQEYNDLFYDVDRKLKLAQEQAVKQVNAAQAQLNALNAMLEQGEEQQLTLEEISELLRELMERYQQELADITGGGSLSQREALIQAKVDQLNAIAQGGRTDWTAESFLSYMYGQGLTLQSWYDRFGKNENLGVSYDSGAAYQAILKNKADLMNAGLTLAAGQTAGGWTAEKVLDQIRRDGMTIDEWYLRYGMQEGVGDYYKKYSQDAADSTNEVIEDMEKLLSGDLSSINRSLNGLDWNVVVNVGGSSGVVVSGGGSSSGGSSGGSTSSGGTASGGWNDILQDKADALNRGETLAPGQTAGGWTADKVLAQINKEGMTVSEWYDKYGKAEGFASGGITPVGKPFWVGENGPELMMSPRQYGVLSSPDSLALMDRPVMDSSSIITAIRDSGQSIYSVLRQLLTKTDAIYGQQRRILQRLDMWDAEGLPS